MMTKNKIPLTDPLGSMIGISFLAFSLLPLAFLL